MITNGLGGRWQAPGLDMRERRRDRLGKGSEITRKKQWACLPAGPLERQLRKEIQGGFWEEVRNGPSKRNSYLSRKGHIRGSLCLLFIRMHENPKGWQISRRICPAIENFRKFPFWLISAPRAPSREPSPRLNLRPSTPLSTDIDLDSDAFRPGGGVLRHGKLSMELASNGNSAI